MSLNSIEAKWNNLAEFWRLRFDKELSVQAALWVISMQEYPLLHAQYCVPDPVIKQDLLHLAVCFLLDKCGFCTLESLDEDGWPRYSSIDKFEQLDLEEQERILASAIVNYFNLP